MAQKKLKRQTASNAVAHFTPRGGHGRGNEKTPFENFEDLATKLLRVSKEEADEQARKRKQD